jgi:hypothetical protein
VLESEEAKMIRLMGLSPDQCVTLRDPPRYICMYFTKEAQGRLEDR